MVPPGDEAPATRALTVDALDVLTELRIEDGALGATMAELLAGTTTHVPEDPDRATVRVSGQGPFEVVSGEERTVVHSRAAAVGHALAALNRRATSDTPLLACHSAVLACGDAGLLVPAASGSGKSTLTAALLHHGWVYGSDEALGLTWDTGETHAYPRPLALSRWSAEVTGTPGGVQGVGETYHLPASRLASGVPIAHVVLLERGGAEPALQPLHRATALVELMRRSFTHHRDPGQALLRYADLLRAASCWRLTLGHPMAAAELVSQRLGG